MTGNDTTNQIPGRHLDWPLCYNTRDLGGLPAGNGKMTRWRAVIRSDILSRLTDTGQQSLLDYGVRTIIDLRSPGEVAKEPSITIPDCDPHLDYMNLPLEKYYPHVSALINQAKSRSEVYCIILDHYPDAVVEVMRAISKAQPGGIVVHCHAGKDRTGIVSALLLGLMGVPADIIAADYAESQLRLWPLYEKILAETGEKDDADFWQKPTATADMMYRMLEHVDALHGSIEQYLRGSGLTASEIHQIKVRMVTI
jgi:protein-tyrosine phosphatase